MAGDMQIYAKILTENQFTKDWFVGSTDVTKQVL